jgi:hypothetical protein
VPPEAAAPSNTFWEQMTDLWPAYNDYQKPTDRQIPVVVIDPIC